MFKTLKEYRHRVKNGEDFMFKTIDKSRNYASLFTQVTILSFELKKTKQCKRKFCKVKSCCRTVHTLKQQLVFLTKAESKNENGTGNI